MTVVPWPGWLSMVTRPPTDRGELVHVDARPELSGQERETAARLDGYRTRGELPPSHHSAVYYPDAEPTPETGVVAMTTSSSMSVRPRRGMV